MKDNRQQRFWEEIEACRPGSDDLQRGKEGELTELAGLADELPKSAELQSRYQAVQQLDAKIRDAFLQVDCPQGLAERLEAFVATEAEGSRHSVANEDVEATHSVDVAKPEQTKWTRRRLYVASAAAALLVMACLSPWIFSAKNWNVSEVLAQIPAWKKQASQATWRSNNAPKNRPVSGQLFVGPDEVADLTLNPDSQAAVYRFLGPQRAGNSGEVLLFVIKGGGKSLPPRPPERPHFDSGGVKIGVWSEGGLVYALVVVNSDGDYRRVVGSMTLRAA